MFDAVIIGCGVVGAAAAYELSKYDMRVCVLEAENDVAMGTSRANSAIIHAGYDPPCGTLMARLNVRGNALTEELCRGLDVPFKRIGSLVLAFSEAERTHITELYERGIQNGVPGLRIVERDELLKMEPNVNSNVVCALHAPTAGIVNPWELTLALIETAVKNGAELHLNSRVTAIEATGGGYRVTVSGGESFETKYIFNAAGVYSDEVHELVGEKEFTITPVRGQYYLLDKSQGGMAGHVLFQCPSPDGKGVLISPTVHGNLIVGPNFERQEDRSDVGTTGQGLEYVAGTAKKTCSRIDFRENIRNFAGIRASAEIDDFIIGESRTARGFFNLAGIKSPGLSAAPAIGEMAAELLSSAGFELKPKKDFDGSRRIIRFNTLSEAEKARLVSEHPEYGRVICRCETVTEGEIRQCFHGPVPPRSIAGVKRRTGAGMGRCQGGFCSPKVCQIIADELGCPPWEVQEDMEGSRILTGPTKTGRSAYDDI